MKVVSSLLCLFLLSSCASYFKRKNCESTDWHAHGYKFAMQGKRLDSDSFIKECKQVEAKVDHAAADNGFKAGMVDYCKVESAFNKGVEGETYNYDFCSSNKIPSLKVSFDRGRTKLCTSGGYKFGASGKAYTSQCNSRGESSFLKDYNRGRYKYLQSEIRLSRNETYEIDRKIRNIQNDIYGLQGQINSLGSGQVLVRERKYDEFSRTYREEIKQTENASVANERSRLSNIISRKRSEISSLKNEQESLHKKIREYQRELTKIDRN